MSLDSCLSYSPALVCVLPVRTRWMKPPSTWTCITPTLHQNLHQLHTRLINRTAGDIIGVYPAVYPLKCPGSIRATAGKLPGNVPATSRKTS